MPAPTSRGRRREGRARARRSSSPACRVSVTRPRAAQMPLSRPMPVAATPSRARKPKSDAVNCSGTVKARMQSATCFPSVGSTQPSCSPDMTNVAAASPKKPSASGPAIGRSVTIACVAASSSRAAFSRRRLGHPTTSACGAPVLILVVNHFACGFGLRSGIRSRASAAPRRARLCRLRGHRPGDRRPPRARR